MFSRVGPQEEREILELRLDRVARLDVRRELRVEGGELADALPRCRERRQRRVVSLVQRRVGLGAEPLQPIGVREDLPGRRQLLVFARLAARPCRSRRAGTRGTRRATPSAVRWRRGGRARRAPAASRGTRPRPPSRSGVSPENSSSRSRCAAGSSRTWCSCWPCRSTSDPAASRSAALVTSAPSTNARLRPCDEISRRTITSPPSGFSKTAWTVGGFLAGPDEVGAGAAADEQSDRPDEDGLAGAGFAGQDVQARARTRAPAGR